MITDQTARELTRNELATLNYLQSHPDALSSDIGRAVFPDRRTEHAAAGSAVAAHLRRKGLVMAATRYPGTWRITDHGRTALTLAQKETGDG